MNIKDLQINGFGKLSNKEIKLDKKINIIYGKNEAGKSTLLGFIKSMFYGASKLKNGKDISDFEKYIPWRTDNFSGRISYELDNGECFDIYRDFKSKNPVIYNKNKQDISLNYPIDKTRGIDYIFQQLNIDEETFKNTVIISQDDVKVNKNAQNGLIQKISNMVSTGDENVSYKKTLEKINKLQLENVGTDRTREKPINIINDKIEKIKASKGKIDGYKEFIEESELEVQKIQNDIENHEIELALYKILKESNEKSKIKNSEIEAIKNIRDDYFEKIKELDEKIDKNAKDKIKNEKRSSEVYDLCVAFLIIGACVCLFMKLHIIIPIVLILISIFVFVYNIIEKTKFKNNKNKKIKELEELENKIEQEINILKNNIKFCQTEIDSKQNEIKEVENEINRVVMNNFEEVLDSEVIEEAFELENQEVDRVIANINDDINRLKIEKGAKQNQKDLMQEEINELAKVQEEINSLEEEKNDLLSLNNSYNLAKEGLESAYEHVRNSISPEFTEKLSEISSQISDGKYKEINFVDTDGLIVQVEDGRFFPVERLSQGTIDQMYLGLRMASIDTISNENIPIILDETFAFFDDDRLKNILKFINENYKKRQIIIFTCSHREIEILNKMNIEYNYISLEK